MSLPHEQSPNLWTTPDLTFQFHYFAMRKMHLAMRANGLVVFPGGFGTLDELFEILTLRATDKAPPVAIVLFDEAYWRSIVNFDVLVEQGMVSPEEVALFRFADDAEGRGARWRRRASGSTGHEPIAMRRQEFAGRGRRAMRAPLVPANNPRR